MALQAWVALAAALVTPVELLLEWYHVAPVKYNYFFLCNDIFKISDNINMSDEWTEKPVSLYAVICFVPVLFSDTSFHI
jgi:hypothetical protein